MSKINFSPTTTDQNLIFTNVSSMTASARLHPQERNSTNTICTTGTQKAAKMSNNNSSFTWVPSIFTESMNASHPLVYSQIHVIIFPTKAKLLYTLIKTNSTHNSSIRSDEGLTLETSAFQIFHGGNSTFMNSFDKTKFLFHSPTDHCFFRSRNLFAETSVRLRKVKLEDFKFKKWEVLQPMKVYPFFIDSEMSCLFKPRPIRSN